MGIKGSEPRQSCRALESVTGERPSPSNYGFRLGWNRIFLLVALTHTPGVVTKRYYFVASFCYPNIKWDLPKTFHLIYSSWLSRESWYKTWASPLALYEILFWGIPCYIFRWNSIPKSSSWLSLTIQLSECLRCNAARYIARQMDLKWGHIMRSQAVEAFVRSSLEMLSADLSS